ncbi:MAG TPA: type II 3-dehydroquinate dehydratase [Rhodothermales bacterium]|nr:type II 3-dehydroquinate dehydratase [Rhodothermales bacterium]
MVLNGPNLNLLGTRQTDVYGQASLADVEARLRASFPGVSFKFVQSNHEGGLVDALHEAEAEAMDGVVLNAAAYTHTSIALRDAIAAISVPVVEVHISNVHSRETFRRRSMISSVCRGQVTGLGIAGYRLAVSYFSDDWTASRT